MEPSFDPTVFTKNRRRLLRDKVGRTLFEEEAFEADSRGLMSDEHFSMDGTLIEAAASIKGFRIRNAKCCDYGVPQTSGEDVEVDSRYGSRGALVEPLVGV